MISGAGNRRLFEEPYAGKLHVRFCEGQRHPFTVKKILRKDCRAVYSTSSMIMPTIMPIRDLRNTSEISEIAHKLQEPIFITKNGYSDLVVMSAELYERFAQINRIDQAIYEAEAEAAEGAAPVSLNDAKSRLDERYYGKV